MEDPGRTLAVLLERAEERCAVALRDTTQDTEVQLQQAVPDVEHPPEASAEPAGDVLHVDLGRQVEVEFGSQPGQRRGQGLGPLVGGRVLADPVGDAGVDEVRQCRQVPRGVRTEPASDHHRLDVHVEPRGDQRLHRVGHDHDLVDEFVVGAPPAVHLPAQHPLLRLRQVLDREDFEVQRLAFPGLRDVDPAGLGAEEVLVVDSDALDVAGPVPAPGQRVVDECDGLGELAEVAEGEQPVEFLELRAPGVGPVVFQRPQVGQQFLAGPTLALAGPARRGQPGQHLGGLVESIPGVRAPLPDAVVHPRPSCHLLAPPNSTRPPKQPRRPD